MKTIFLIGGIVYLIISASCIRVNGLTSAINKQRINRFVAVDVEKAAKLAHAYSPSTFNPPVWAQNPHFQTIVGALARNSSRYVSNNARENIENLSLTLSHLMNGTNKVGCPSFWDERIRYSTWDEGFIDVDCKYYPMADARVILIHGLQSSSYSPLSIDIARAFHENLGMDVMCMNLRNCSGDDISKGIYHLGFTDDLIFLLDELNKDDDRPIYLTGFSLGANNIMNFLVQNGEEALTKYNVRGAALNAVPFDVFAGKDKLYEMGFSRVAYGNPLLASMKASMKEYFSKVFEKHPIVNVDIDNILGAQTIRDFEAAVVCPAFGFNDTDDYYLKTSTITHLNNVYVPTFVINSNDDPFFDSSSFPKEDKSIPLKLLYTEFGGHCGHIVHRHLQDDYFLGNVSWAPNELSSFIGHVHGSM